jgi:hypothetical protein
MHPSVSSTTPSHLVPPPTVEGHHELLVLVVENRNVNTIEKIILEDTNTNMNRKMLFVQNLRTDKKLVNK